MSGRTAGDLRRWCATGRLRCERLGDDWLVLEDDIHLAIDLRDATAGGAGRAVLSIAFPDRGNGQRALELLRSRFGLGAGEVGLAPLALDGADLVLVAGVFPQDALEEVVTIVQSLDGIIVDGIDAMRVGAPRLRRDDEQGQSSYG